MEKDGKDDKKAIKRKVINAVKNGMSFRQASIKFNVYISTVDFWCRNAGVKSKYKKQTRKATDKDIVDAVKKNKVITVKQLEEIFGYQTNTARRRLMRLAREGKLEYIVLGGGGKAASLFKDYTERRIYYATKEDLQKWIKTKFLINMPRNLKVAITHKLHRDSGIDIKFEEPKKKALLLDKSIYNKIKNKASKSGISPAEYIKKVA